MGKRSSQVGKIKGVARWGWQKRQAAKKGSKKGAKIIKPDSLSLPLILPPHLSLLSRDAPLTSFSDINFSSRPPLRSPPLPPPPPPALPPLLPLLLRWRQGPPLLLLLLLLLHHRSSLKWELEVAPLSIRGSRYFGRRKK